MPDEMQSNPGAPSTPPDNSTNPSPSERASFVPAGPPQPSPPPSPPPPTPSPSGLKLDLPPLQPTKESPGVLKVDIGKDALKKFEIHTMSDDLGQPVKASPGLGSSSLTPPTPKTTPPPLPKPVSSSSSKAPSPPLPPETPEMLFEEEPKHGGVLKSFLLGFLVILLLGGLGLGTWWYLGFNPPDATTPLEPTTTPPPDDTPPVVTLDTPLLPVDQSFTIELSADATRRELFQKLSSHVNTTRDLSSQDLARIVLTKNNTLLTLAEFEALLEVDFSPYVDQGVFTLLYSPQQSGATYGLVLKIADSEKLGEFFASKEKDISFLANDMYTSYTSRALPQASTEEFLDNTYQGVQIRYMNFGTPDRSFDYAMYQDFLLLGGSKDITFSLVNRAKLTSLLGGNR